jgi:fibronectin type 3 domain-containing protein
MWLAACLLSSALADAQTDVLVSHNDNFRTGQNLSETTLSSANVNVGTFGKLYSLPVDGQVYGQPLVKASLAIPGKGTFNVVFIVTEHGSVYALDANTATPIWQRSFINLSAGITPRPADVNSIIVPEISITSTPVIDPASGTLYVVAETRQSGNATYSLYALDITTGVNKIAPVLIQASVGSGAPPLTLNASQSQQRPGLVLSNGVVYVAFGSNSDDYPWVGWLLGYNATTLAQVAVFCTSTDGTQGAGLWSSGEAPPVDASGNLYAATGNGTFDGATDWADAYLKLSTAGGLTVTDYFAPFNQSALGSADLDVAASGITLLPDAAGSATHPHLLVGAGKDGELYLVDRDNMGQYNGSYNNPNSQIVQWIPNAVGGHPLSPTQNPLPYVENFFSTPAYWQNRLYFCGVDDSCRAFNISNAQLGTTSASNSPTTYAYPGGQPVISAASSAATSAIMWTIQRDSVNNVSILHAYDATNLATELYNSNQAPGKRDQGGVPITFAVPTVANGKVIVGADSEIDVYGLLASNPSRLGMPTFAPAPGSYTAGQTVTISAPAAATIYYTVDGSQPTLSSPVYSGPIALAATTTTISAIAVQSGWLTSPTTSGVYTLGAAAPIAFVQQNYATPQTTQASISVRFNSTQRAGDLNVVVIGWNDSTATLKSVTDSAGNLYAPAFAAPTIQSGVATQTIYYAKNIASGSNTVTVAFNGAAVYADIRIAEYSGLDTAGPLDVSAAAMGGSTNSSSGAATTNFANELIIGANLVQTGTTAAGSGFTSRAITVPDGDILEDRIVSTSGSYTASAPVSPSGAWIMQMVTFKAASSAGGGTVTPTAPSNLTATAISGSEIDLSWGAATESGGTIAQYVIERCGGAGCSTFAQVGITTTATSYADQLVSAATSYTYRVRAVDGSSVSGPYSNTATAVTPGGSPTAPTNLVATAAGSAQINLSWSASSESGGTISQYRIERCQGANCSSYAQIATSTGLSFSDTPLSGNTTYSYRVRAADSNGNTGPYSNVARATTAAATFTAPGNLTASAASGSQINLSWTAASETGGTISAYLIERCQGAGCSTFTQIGSVTGTSYNDTGLSVATAYSYRVRATDTGGNQGPYSSVASATTTGATPVITYVQQNYASPQTPQTRVPVNFTAPQASGDLNVVVVGWNDSTATVGTVTDSSGNVYQPAVGPTVQSGTATQAIYYAANIAGAAANANTVTVTFTTAAIYADIRILEYGGIDPNSPLDVTATGTGSSPLSSTAAVTTTYANDLIIGANLVQTGTTGAGAGFTSRVITQPDGDIVEDRIVTATGSYSATAPVSPSAAWIMQLAAFRRHP